MKTFRDLEIASDLQSVAAVLDGIDSRLDDGWRRDVDAEKRLERATGDRDMRCYACQASPGRHAAALWLTRRDDGTLWVSNIVPSTAGELSYDQYNRVLEEFAEKYATPSAIEAGVHVDISPAEVSIDALVGFDVADRLRTFSHAANRATGASHPLDRARWNDFVIASHRTGCELEPDTLQRWLVEEEAWPEHIAADLAIKYEYARSLLRDRDRVDARSDARHH